ncbi:MAG: hypothetical protein L6R39_002868, partial [Caloplaca ligustica]
TEPPAAATAGLTSSGDEAPSLVQVCPRPRLIPPLKRRRLLGLRPWRPLTAARDLMQIRFGHPHVNQVSGILRRKFQPPFDPIKMWELYGILVQEGDADYGRIVEKRPSGRACADYPPGSEGGAGSDTVAKGENSCPAEASL